MKFILQVWHTIYYFAHKLNSFDIAFGKLLENY